MSYFIYLVRKDGQINNILKTIDKRQKKKFFIKTYS